MIIIEIWALVRYLAY